MNIQMATFALGGVLLMIGVLGGGFEVKEFKVPKVSGFARVASFGLGIVFALFGFKHPEQLTDTTVNSARDTVNFRIFDELGDDQLSENMSLIIDGRVVGVLNVNREFRQTMLTVTVPASGMHSFTVKASGTFVIDGQPVQLKGVGQGSIDIQSGDDFHLTGSTSGHTWIVGMVENEKGGVRESS